MNELTDQNPAVTFRVDGDPPETYEVLINAPGLARADDGSLKTRHIHRCRVYLHADYPRRPPVITWMTPIVHPNILPPSRNGGVCLGSWSASESLADVVRRLIDLVSYRAFNISDALDRETAAWVEERGLQPGANLQLHLDSENEDNLGEVPVSLSRKPTR